MLHDFYFNREFVQCLYEQHLFFIEKDTCYLDISIFRIAFLLWVEELSLLPTIKIDQITRLLLWGKNNISFEHGTSPSKLVAEANFAWRNILLSPQRQDNPALCSLILRSIDKEYTDLTLKKLSERLDLNASYISRVISRDIKCAFPDLLQCRRILSAVSVLHTPRRFLSIESISNSLGYSSPHYFCYVFKSYIGTTPARAREIIMLLEQ